VLRDTYPERRNVTHDERGRDRSRMQGFDKGRGTRRLAADRAGLPTCPHGPVRVPARVPLSNPGAVGHPGADTRRQRRRPAQREWRVTVGSGHREPPLMGAGGWLPPVAGSRRIGRPVLSRCAERVWPGSGDMMRDRVPRFGGCGRSFFGGCPGVSGPGSRPLAGSRPHVHRGRGALAGVAGGLAGLRLRAAGRPPRGRAGCGRGGGRACGPPTRWPARRCAGPGSRCSTRDRAR